MSEQRMLAILGMRDSGKTTYLARLWLGVHEKVGRLHAVGLPEQLQPLREISTRLLRNNYPLHTPLGKGTAFVVPLRWMGRKEPVPFTLSFADYAGEEIEHIFTQRDVAWTEAWKTRATGAVGLAVFLRPQDTRRLESKRLHPPPDDEDLNALSWANLRGELPDAVVDPSKPVPVEDSSTCFPSELLPQDLDDRTPVTDPREQVCPPTAVALVEVLQFLRHERGLDLGELPDADSFRVAVVVSCWDSVPEDWRKQGPYPFVEKHFPLLYDFLCTNFHSDGVRFFGLSSTGGDLTDETFRRKYEQSEPEHMGELVYHPSPTGSPVSVPDIALPIGWLLEGESALPDPPKT